MGPLAPFSLWFLDPWLSDEEIILFLGGRKIGDPAPFNVTTAVNPFSSVPWDFPAEYAACLYNSEDVKSHNGERYIEVDKIGYWRSVEELRILTSSPPAAGWKTTWEFYLGQAPFGDRTRWSMHEFQADEKPCCGGVIKAQDHSSLFRIFLRNGDDDDDSTNCEEVHDPVASDEDSDGEYLESMLLSLAAQEEWGEYEVAYDVSGDSGDEYVELADFSDMEASSTDLYIVAEML